MTREEVLIAIVIVIVIVGVAVVVVVVVVTVVVVVGYRLTGGRGCRVFERGSPVGFAMG
jgi:heme/copper-type cytochrome/quinol oxidase subunit 2